MAKSSFTRREFLKVSALGTSAMALSSCTSMDRYFMGDSRDLKNEVLILGAGAAGLAAAFELKRKKVPFRIFEASSRIGGRVQSVAAYQEQGPVAELGAEFVDLSHIDVFNLAKELNLPLIELKSLPDLEAHLFSFSGKTYRVKDIVPKLKTLQAPLRRIRSDLYRDQEVVLNYANSLQYERSLYYDTLSLKDLLDSWVTEVDPVILKLIEVQAVQRFGVDAKDQSALHFLSTLDGEGSSLLSGRTTYRMDGGMNGMTQTLAARVAGVIPDHILRLNSALIEVEEKENVFTFIFATPKGKEKITASTVICTIPFSKLREVKGVEKLRFSALKLDNIKNQAYATHSKGVVPFAQPFWKTRRGNTPANVGNFTGDFTSQKIWDSSRAQEVTQGLLTFQRGGASGAKAGATAIDETLKDLKLFYNDIPNNETWGAQVANWSTRKWSGGSMAVFKPGQYMKYKGVAAIPEYDGKFLFAGEHTSLRFAGTLQGAIETGMKAAQAITG